MWLVSDTRMITRALVLALWCAYASALTPLSAAADDNECALYLAGPGRTSSFDYSLNLLRGNFGYEGQHTCITYEAVNQAYLDARKRILVAQPKGDWKPEDYASVGELILDISISLARTYGLTYEEIEKGLPLIDTSRTLIREVCPPVFSHVECRAGKYRRLDGLCNNLEHPTWGATNAPFQRLIGPLFSDGINSPRISHTGRDLPLSRVVSRTMHPDEGFHDHAGTVMVIAWGQFMDHDYTLTGTPLDPVNRNDPEECCKRPPHQKHPYCNEIRIPDDDYFYRLFGVKCIDFVRAFPSPRPGCRLGSRVPFNTLTGAIDGNTVYGVTDKFARKLRTGYGGLLRMNPVFTEYGLKDLLPLKLDIPDEGCTRPNKNMYCFEAGEIRVNEQLVLTVMHTLMAREHNRVAKALAEVNPHWDDETLYQEARRINIAEIQHITYNEFLPILLGKDVMDKFGLVLEKEGYWDGYDKTVNPDVIDSFASAAYRFGHSLLPTAVERWSKAHKFIASKRLSDLIRRPYDLYRAGVLDEYVMGLMNQVAQAMDDSITQEVTNHLFKKVGARFGMDLVSFNMQRGREFGIPGYMEYRKFCGLGGAETFDDLHGSMPNETVGKYGQIFEHPVDIDLWSGGVSERPLPGSMLGPTFACIIATQFSYSRRGDRFWFELPNQPSSFTPEQLVEIKKSRLARVICDNTDIIDTVQLYPMVLPDHELNPRVPCRSGIMPSMDFSKWAEPAPSPFHGAAKQFNVTVAVIVPQNNSTLTENGTLNDRPKDAVPESPEKVDEHELVKAIVLNGTLCDSKKDNSTGECIRNTIKEVHNSSDPTTALNNVTSKDSVMEYVSGKNDDVPLKTSGHIRNSLKRRKRALTIVPDNIRSNSAPEILHYETRHGPSQREPLLPFHKLTDNKIQSANLADFNIETLHEPATDAKENNKESWKDNQKLPPPKEDSNDSIENDTSEERKPYVNERDNNSEERKPYVNERDNTSEKRKPYVNERDNNSEERKRYVNERDNNSEERKPYVNERDNNSEERKPYVNERDNNSEERKPYVNERDNNSEERKPYVNDRDNDSEERKPYVSDRDDNSEERRSHNASDESIETNNEENRERSRGSNNRGNERLENDDIKSPLKDNNSGETLESNESGEDRSRNSKDFAAHARNINSDEVEDSDERDSPRENYSESHKNEDESQPKRSSTGDSTDESNEEKGKPREDRKHPTSVSDSNSDGVVPRGIQDVDLGDFSYERIQVDKDGKVELAKDIYGEDNNDSKEERPSYDKTSKHKANPLSKYIEKVNNGEIKPVVEINTESNSNEYSDENVETDLQQPHKAELTHSERARLEDLSGAKENDSGEKSEKQVAQKEEQQNGDVKQQFERIPLNYKHDKKTKDSKNEKEAPRDEPENEKDGTLDTLLPEDQRYDEKLNFKFDDVSIKLPDIKLPDDVLSYDYKSSPYKKTNKKKPRNKNRFYHYSDEHSDEFPKEISIPQYDDRDYYKYDDTPEKKQNYKKKSANNDEDYDDEGVDLYEKFVRERFGKRGSFEKRSEALRNEVFRPSDPKLGETIQQILKKSSANLKEAEKSGDPKAGYMWTLEYGQNL